MKTQKVTATLRNAGYKAYRKGTRREAEVKGYMVVKVNSRAVAVFSDRVDGEAMEWSEKFEKALTEAGLKVQRPFNDPTILGIAS